MLTRCPSCQTTFKVTSDILRVADGQVRCGRCQYQFNALLYLQHSQRDTDPLRDADDHWDHDEEPSIASRLVQPPRVPAPAAPDDDELNFRPALRHRSTPPEAQEDAAQEEHDLEPQEFADDLDAFTLQDIDEVDATSQEHPDDDASAAEELQDEEEAQWQDEDPANQPASKGATRPQRQLPPWAIAQSTVADDAAKQQLIDRVIADTIAEEDAQLQAQAEEIIAERRQRPAWRDEPPQVADDAELDSELDLLAQPRQRSSIVWKLLLLPLLALLIVQVTHNHRATLARHPQLGEPLQQIYAGLGLTLRPDWDLQAYEVRQWGVIADPATPGTLVVRASIKNLAAYAQPYPQLKLMLEDRWGEQVRARAFDPVEYLDATAAPERLLLPGQQANATIAIVDPGPDAEGFRFDVCLRGTRGAVCAADLPRR